MLPVAMPASRVDAKEKVLIITGRNFGASAPTVMLSDQVLKVKRFSENQVVASLPHPLAAAGDVLISQGDLNRDYLVLLEGQVEIRRLYQTEEGTEELEVGRLSPGHGMGEIAVLYGVPRQANVRAVVFCTKSVNQKAAIWLCRHVSPIAISPA